MIRLLAFLFCLMSSAAMADTLRMAVTTSFHNSGLSDVLLPAIRQDTGIDVQLLVVGTGQALRLGEAGDVDAILVHARQAEDAFVQAGFAPYRREIMYNDFVLIGPRSDPAQVGTARGIAEAMQRLGDTQTPFVSRGDDSGTHKKEQSLWRAAGLNPGGFGAWYNSVGAGMGASLNTASGLNAYILADRASWLNFANKGALDLLFSGDAALFNQYAYLPIDPKRHPHVNADSTRVLEDWLTGPTAKELINGYRIEGETLFVFNAEP